MTIIQRSSHIAKLNTSDSTSMIGMLVRTFLLINTSGSTEPRMFIAHHHGAYGPVARMTSVSLDTRSLPYHTVEYSHRLRYVQTIEIANVRRESFSRMGMVMYSSNRNT